MLFRVLLDINKKQLSNCFFGSPSWTRTNDLSVNSRALYQLSYWGIKKSGNALFSQQGNSQVSSAPVSLTSVFGMGTGVSSLF